MADTARARTAALSAPGTGGSGPARERPLRDRTAAAGDRARLDGGLRRRGSRGGRLRSLFARRYLSWDSRDPEAHRLALAPFVGSSMEAEAGLQPPESGEQQVQWTQVVQARAARSRRAAVHRCRPNRHGRPALPDGRRRSARPTESWRSPAIRRSSARPPSTGAASPAHLREVEDPALETVVTRALRNYLAPRRIGARRRPRRRRARLAAGLTLALQSLEQPRLVIERPLGARDVRARDERGAQYTLAYELDVRLERRALGDHRRSRRTPTRRLGRSVKRSGPGAKHRFDPTRQRRSSRCTDPDQTSVRALLALTATLLALATALAPAPRRDAPGDAPQCAVQLLQRRGRAKGRLAQSAATRQVKRGARSR